MNKVRKKLRALIAVCLLLPCISMIAHAAGGVLTFSDPTVKAGENVTVKVKLDAQGAPIGDGDITISYDTAKLEFISGENASGGEGEVKLSATGNGSDSTLVYTMDFRALEEGQTKITVKEYTAYLYSDETMDVTLGDSTVTIEPGDPNAQEPEEPTEPTAEGPEVTVDGIAYKISGDFTEVMVPAGFVSSTITYEGQECPALYQEASGMYMVYLVSADNTGKMFLYNPSSNQFSVCERIRLSDTKDIILLKDEPAEALPESYKKAEFEINGVAFPAWQNPSQPEFFIVNALNSAGQQAYYQYDSADETFQRFFVSAGAAEEKEAKGFFGKLEAKLKEHLNIVLIAAWGVFLVCVIIIITLSIKLRHRNEELDDWYEDFGDQYEAKVRAEKSKSAKKPEAKKAKKVQKAEPKAKPKYEPEEDLYDEDGLYDDDYDDDDLFMDDEDDVYIKDEEFEDEVEYENEDSDVYDEDDMYDGSEDVFSEDDMYDGNMFDDDEMYDEDALDDEDDDFSMDFIDLD